MNQQTSIGRPSKRLTDEQMEALKKKILGYGNFRKTAYESKLPEATLRYVLIRGYGEPKTVNKILKVLGKLEPTGTNLQ